MQHRSLCQRPALRRPDWWGWPRLTRLVLHVRRNLTDYWKWAQIDVWERVADSESKFCHKHIRRRATLPPTHEVPKALETNSTQSPSPHEQKLPPLRRILSS